MAESKYYGKFLLELRSNDGRIPVVGALVQIAHGGVIVSSLYTDAEGDGVFHSLAGNILIYCK